MPDGASSHVGQAESEFMAMPTWHGPQLKDGQFYNNWFVFWACKDGTATGARGQNMTAAAAHRLADDINAGRETP